jgi:acetyl esterase
MFASSFHDLPAVSPEDAKARFNPYSVRSPSDTAEEMAAVRSALAGDFSLLTARRSLSRPRKVVPGIAANDITISGPRGPLLLREFCPESRDPSGLPAVIYLHGGGWVFGSVARANFLASRLSQLGTFRVLSVDYSRSPDVKAGVAIEEAFAVWKWLSRQFVVLAGDSSGGNLAAALALKILTAEPNAKLATILFYPVIDLVNVNYESYLKYGVGYGLDLSLMRLFIESYVPDPADRSNPLFSPIFGDCRNFPPTLILTAEFDILRDEARAFAKKLDENGVSVRYRCVEGALHGFAGQCEWDDPRLEKLHRIVDEEVVNFLQAIVECSVNRDAGS